MKKLLLKLINTPLGKRYLGIKETRKIVDFSGWGYTVKISRRKYQAKFATHPYIARRLPFFYLPHLWDMYFANRYAPALNLGYDTFAVGAGGGDTVDSTAAEDWATKRARSASGSVRDTSSNAFDRLHATDSGGGDFQLGRVSLITDTSALPDSATVTSATYTVKSTAQTITNTYTAALVGNTQASDTLLATGDFDQFGSLNSPTEYATRITITGASQTIVFTLDAGGLAAISKTTYTKFGMRSNMDIDNSAPSGGANVIRIDWDAGNTFLTVNYTVATSGFLGLF